MADTGASDGVSDGVWFISHAGADRAWAEWIAWQLLDAGHEVELDCWDWGTGDNFILKMNAALEQGRMLALFSPAYFEPERFTTPEWTAMLARQKQITPVRIAKTPTPAILSPFIVTDLFGLDEQTARDALLNAVTGPSRPGRAPVRPPGMLSRIGGTGPRLPGSLPRVRNLPPRNAAFTGRDGMLVHLREALASGQRVAVQALHGRGGVGKTQLALEYAYRFAGEYEFAWWITAEDPALIPDQLARLAVRAGIAPAGTPSAVAVELLLAELGTMSRWLLVFDNAEDPDALAPFLPGGLGHVLITSRNSLWTSYAVPVDVSTLSRTESMALLRARGAALTDVDASSIAATLDDLPLALAQAAALLVRGLSAADLKEELAANLVEVMAHHPPPGYPAGLAAQVRLTRSRLKAEHPGVVVVVDALALLAPEPFPLTTCAGHLPEQASALLVETMGSRLAAGSAVEAVARHGLARVQDGTLQLHRLTQDMLVRQMTGHEHDQALADAEALLTAADPGDTREPRLWPAWQVLLPHALTLDPAQLATSRGRDVLREACWYLMDRGQVQPARERLQTLYDACLQQLGPDHGDTLRAAQYLARAYSETQDHGPSRALYEDTLNRFQRLLGDEDPDTLNSALNLAEHLRALGEHKGALALDAKTLAVQRRVLGAEHPDTLITASNLVVDLARVGRVGEAVVLGEETLDARRRVLGVEHPDTLRTATNQANRLAEVGRVGEAVVLGEETLDARRRVLGVQHPDTLLTAYNLGIRLAEAGRVEDAVDLGMETLEARRFVLGAEHPDTLATANDLAVHLWDVGRVGAARALGEETLEARSRVLGEDHPQTRNTAAWLEELVKGQGPTWNR
ncbi:FxSxx-COOH system tetratricopeptide repeat protein [Streptomyces justiciae]|uniref:FxSxx-COOH system tetratricopeptide repeat protein n=1 Tax=Streptomyces justiciae TaxID=2780140 RepID=A0ABU3M9K9_9ACTN|nr:FxSxx-COOH system tetratricopeptide repeat protein [Streptomyces justiciae]MDT7847856.1 FxSxx-COOH system tetratricopeptide repeat protein [Streptomyces justiciae]